MKSDIKTEEYANMLIISGDANKFQTIKSEKQDQNNRYKQFIPNKNNNKHVFIPKKIKGKQFLGNAKRNIDFNNV